MLKLNGCRLCVFAPQTGKVCMAWDHILWQVRYDRWLGTRTLGHSLGWLFWPSSIRPLLSLNRQRQHTASASEKWDAVQHSSHPISTLPATLTTMHCRYNNDKDSCAMLILKHSLSWSTLSHLGRKPQQCGATEPRRDDNTHMLIENWLTETANETKHPQT